MHRQVINPGRRLPTSFRQQIAPAQARAGLEIGLFMLWLVAVNLRTGLIGVGPLLPHLTANLDLSKTQGSILVALPTALMGLAALPGGRMADYLGPRRTITIGLALVAIAGGFRALAPGYAVLIAFTVMFGIGIGITQPSLPRLSRGLLPERVGIATGIYAGGFFIGAVLPALLTAPVLLGSETDDWRLPLAVWGIAGLVSLGAWLMALNRWQLLETGVVANSPPAPSAVGETWSPWRNRQAWVVAGIFAGQGLAYYLMVAWLPSVYDEAGFTEQKATVLYAIFTLMTFPAMVGLPPLSDRIGSRRLPVMLAAGTFLASALGLAFAINAPILGWLWPALAAFGVAGLFGMALLMPIDVAPPGHTGATAGMVLGIGYAGSAIGPVLGGVLRDRTGSFETALLILPVLGLALLLAGVFVPDPHHQRR